MRSSTDDYAERVTIRCPADIRPAAESLHAAAMAMARLRTAACANIASKDVMIDANGAILAAEVFGWVEEGARWWENSKIALTSPLVIACRYESEPFWCNEGGIYTRQPNPHLADLDLTDFLARAMSRAAIVVPIHLPFGQIAAVSFTPLERERVDLSAEFVAHADTLELYARRFICGYVKVMEKRRRIQSDVRLSKREVQCLRWAALGKTDKEIALILRLSCATVRFHIHNAAVKLDAVNRTQTLFKASQLGYLGAVA